MNLLFHTATDILFHSWLQNITLKNLTFSKGQCTNRLDDKGLSHMDYCSFYKGLSFKMVKNIYTQVSCVYRRRETGNVNTNFGKRFIPHILFTQIYTLNNFHLCHITGISIQISQFFFVSDTLLQDTFKYFRSVSKLLFLHPLVKFAISRQELLKRIQ